MMNTRRGRGIFLVIWLLLVLGSVFIRHHSYLNQGWFQDDYAFLESAGRGYYGAHPHTWLDWVAFWNPWRGWFYRPVFLNYWAIFHALGIAHPPIMHCAGLILHSLVVFFWGYLAYRLTKRALVGVLASLSFLLWPDKEEAIWWIASHSTLLAALFSIGTLHLWLSWRETEKRSFFCPGSADLLAGLLLQKRRDFPYLRATFAGLCNRTMAREKKTFSFPTFLFFCCGSFTAFVSSMRPSPTRAKIRI